MAEIYSSHGAGGYMHEPSELDASTSAPNRLTQMTNVAGAVVSLALVLGVGIWGYKLLVRDVSGIPLVRAAAGEMRIRPEEPGGELAQHQGLSVNAVAADGSAAAPADRLVLAPEAVDLAAEDQPMTTLIVAPKQQEAPVATLPEARNVSAALEVGNMDELVAQLTAGVVPMERSAQEDTGPAVVASVDPVSAAIAIIKDGPVPHSLRPRNRPADLALVRTASVAVPAPAAAETDADALPAGTRLAQLGAFDSPEIARQQWTQMQTRFAALMQGKTRVVQKATSGGRVFYRLRAMGFEDISDARRFCSALVAENADCIPVVTR